MTMNFVIPAVIYAFLALAQSSGPYVPEPNKVDTQIDDSANMKIELNEFSGKLSKYLVLLMEEDTDRIKGTGFIVSLRTIITPSVNLENSGNNTKLYMNVHMAKEMSTICCHYPYDGPLSVAYFYPPIAKQKEHKIPRIPIFPAGNIPVEGLHVMVLGFAEKKQYNRIPSELLYYANMFWYASVTLKKTNPEHQYYPRFGDVISTNGHIMGILICFFIDGRKMTGEFYSPTYPPEDSPRNCPNLACHNN